MSISARDRHAESKLAANTQHSPLTVSTLPQIELYEASLSAITERECVYVILNALNAGHGGWLMTLNLDLLRLYVREPSFAVLVNHASFVVADGMPLIWASRLQKTPLPERITGSNLIWSLSKRAAECGRNVFLLGGGSDSAKRSAQILAHRYTGLRVSGTYSPPFGFEHQPAEMEKLFDAVRSARPDILYVALGSPKQDQVIQQLGSVVPQTWCIGVGVSFSWVAGDLPRAPLWMQQAGLEWLHRLAQEPRRLTRRYLIDDLPFAVQLFAHALKMRLKS